MTNGPSFAAVVSDRASWMPLMREIQFLKLLPLGKHRTLCTLMGDLCIFKGLGYGLGGPGFVSRIFSRTC
jgi:hypothetical protein